MGLIASLVLTGLCMRHLSLIGVSYAESLLWRGLVCLGATLLFAQSHGLSLMPKSLRTQAFRAVIAGLALTFLTLSYNWLSAGAVSVLSNIDVPLLVVMSPWLGLSAARRTKILSIVSILFLVWYVSSLELQEDLFYGLSTLFIGTILLCFGYLYIKKSMNEENRAITILTPAVAIILYGIVQLLFIEKPETLTFSAPVALSSLLSGLGMFGAYFTTMKLYEQTDIATAEFPTLLSSIAIQPIETFFLQTPILPAYLISSIGFVVVTYLILMQQARDETAPAQ